MFGLEAPSCQGTNTFACVSRHIVHATSLSVICVYTVMQTDADFGLRALTESELLLKKISVHGGDSPPRCNAVPSPH
jgi:hypothetical protein